MRDRHLVCTTVTIGLVTTIAYIIYRRTRSKRRRQGIPVHRKWEHVGTVKEISIYPVQSGAPLLLPKAKCSTFGLSIYGLRDRSLVLLNAHDEVAFSGTFPSMLSISTELKNESTLVIRAPNKQSLTLNLDLIAQGKSVIEKQRKGFKMRLIECDSRHHEWFSSVILQRTDGFKLYISLEPQLEFNIWGEDKSDFNPIMVMNNKSVDDLNTRLSAATQVHHLQFRGNIFLECQENINAYDEDNWCWLKIGDTEVSSILHYRAPCKRCISPNVDLKTCRHSPHFEPLKTLKRYRLVHDSKEPTMGAYYSVHTEGSIRVNDPVYVLRKYLV